jgi:hypothetical protein
MCEAMAESSNSRRCSVCYYYNIEVKEFVMKKKILVRRSMDEVIDSN